MDRRTAEKDRSSSHNVHKKNFDGTFFSQRGDHHGLRKIIKNEPREVMVKTKKRQVIDAGRQGNGESRVAYPSNFKPCPCQERQTFFTPRSNMFSSPPRPENSLTFSHARQTMAAPRTEERRPKNMATVCCTDSNVFHSKATPSARSKRTSHSEHSEAAYVQATRSFTNVDEHCERQEGSRREEKEATSEYGSDDTRSIAENSGEGCSTSVN